MARLPASGWAPIRADEIAETAQRIMTAIGQGDKPEPRAAIVLALTEYSDGIAATELATSPTAARRRVAEIEALARDLRDALSALARDRGGDGAAENAYDAIADRLMGGTTIAGARRAIAAMQHAAQHAAQALPSLPGRDANPYRAACILALWEICGGRGLTKRTERGGGYTGPLLDAVGIAIASIEGDRPTAATIGREIEAVRAHAKGSRENRGRL